MDISGRWTGEISGTNRGQLSLQLNQENDEVEGEIVLNDLEFGITKIEVKGKVNQDTILASLKTFLSSAPQVPTNGKLVGKIDKDGKTITGTWETDIGTNGQFVLVKSDNGVTMQTFSGTNTTSGVQATPTQRWNIRTLSINAFLTNAEELKELRQQFQEACSGALALQEEALKKIVGQDQVKALIARIPPPSIEVTAAGGTFFRINNVDAFNPSELPSDTKVINFLGYRQETYLPENGLQIRLSNINGTDPLNPGSIIQLHGSDTIWLNGTSTIITDFFNKRRTRRAWLHKQAVGTLVLYGLVFPLALWLLFRLSPLFPLQLRTNAVLNFGVFIYLYISFYYVFDKTLRYLRWAFPLYEIQFTKPHRRLKHRWIAGTLFIGLLVAFLYDLFKFLVGMVQK